MWEKILVPQNFDEFSNRNHASFFPIFDIIPRWCLFVQNNGNINFWNMLNMHENQCTKFVERQHKDTRTRWIMLFWCLHQRCGYSGPSWISMMELFSKFNCNSKAKIFYWVLNTSLKLWRDFTLIIWLLFGRGFSTVSWSNLF